MPSWISSYLENLLLHYRYAAKEQEVLTAPVFVSPSVVPAFNPALRVMKYDLISGAVVDYEQYYSDLKRWNALPPEEFMKKASEESFYELEYQPVDEYDFKPQTAKPKSWTKFAGRLSRIGRKDWLEDLKKKKKKKKKRPDHGDRDKEEDWLLKTYLRHMVVNVDLTTGSG
jgi:hypothetical protein